MEVSQEHVSAGCNRVVGALHWGGNQLVAYAAHNLVIIYNAQVNVTPGTCTESRSLCFSCPIAIACSKEPACHATICFAALHRLGHVPYKGIENGFSVSVCILQAAKIVATMIGHADRVNCVQWLPTAGKCSTLGQSSKHCHAEQPVAFHVLLQVLLLMSLV